VSDGPVRLPGISSRAWEHPADRDALEALRKVPGFDALIRKVMGLVSERPLRLITRGSAVEVGPRQFPKIDAMYGRLLERLDAPERFPLYIAANPVMGAGAVGMDAPFIVLSQLSVQVLPERELSVLLGRELGHVLSDHVLYKTMLKIVLRGGSLVTRMPLTGIAMLAVVGAMLEWDRKSELSADRASLLAVQDPAAMRAYLLRVAGGTGAGASVPAFQEQARAYEEDSSAVDSVIKTLVLLGRSHPFPVQRLGEVERWIARGDFARILSGDYPLRRDDPERVSWWRESVGAYTDEVRTSAEDLGRWVRSAGEGVADRASSTWSKLRGRDESEPPAGVIDVDSTEAGSGAVSE